MHTRDAIHNKPDGKCIKREKQKANGKELSSNKVKLKKNKD